MNENTNWYANINLTDIKYLKGNQLYIYIQICGLLNSRDIRTGKKREKIDLNNQYFSRNLAHFGINITPNNISRCLRELEKNGYIKIVKEGQKRIITKENPEIIIDNTENIIKSDYKNDENIIKSDYSVIKSDYKNGKTLSNMITKTDANIKGNIKNNKNVANKFADLPAESFFIAKKMAKIIETHFSHQKIDINQWADDINKINRIDKIDWKKINQLFEFAMNSDFWCVNIRSGAKFRKQIPELEAQMIRQKMKSDNDGYWAEVEQKNKEKKLRELNSRG